MSRRLEILPCLPKAFEKVEVDCMYLDAKLHIIIQGEKVLVNGKELTQKRTSVMTKQQVWFIDPLHD